MNEHDLNFIRESLHNNPWGHHGMHIVGDWVHKKTGIETEKPAAVHSLNNMRKKKV